MSEILRQRLANQSRTPYSKGGDIFMGEPGESMSSKDTQPPTFKHGESSSVQKAQISAEKQDIARELWNEFDKDRVLSVDERRTREVVIKRGLPPVYGAQGNGEGDEDANDYRINTEGLDIADKYILEIIRVANDGVRYSTSDESTYNALLKGIENIRALSSEGIGNQKALAEQAIRSQLDNVFQERARSQEIALSQNERAQVSDQISNLRETISGTLGDAEKMDKIEEIINNLDPNDRIYPHVIAEAIAGIENRELDYLVEDTLEYSLERFLNRADAQPLEDYPQFTFGESENIAMITHAARTFDEARKKADPRLELGIEPGRRDMFKYLTTLKNRRQVMHELFRGMSDLESFTGLVTKALRKEGMMFVESEIAGVADVQIIYDQVFLSLKSLKPQEKGWLLEEDFKKGDSMVEDLLKANPDSLSKRFIKNDNSKAERSLRGWEIDRAFHMGRDVSGAAQRRVVYGILGDVPKNVDEFIKSVNHEPIARRLAPLKLIPERFFNHPVAKRFLEIFKEEQTRGDDGEINDTKYGYIAGERVRKDDNTVEVIPTKNAKGKSIKRGMYGSSQDDFAILDLDIADPKTSGWRSRLIFLKNSNFASESTLVDGKAATIGDYLEATKKAMVRSKDAVGREQHNEDLANWNNEISGVISKQRLFLGALMRCDSDLSIDNKIGIWENVARFMPSRIATLLPNETLDIVGEHYGIEKPSEGDAEAMVRWRESVIPRWEAVRDKLWIAERMRVKNDAKALRVGGSGEVKEISAYFEEVGSGIENGEKDLVNKVIKLGKDYAPDLSKIKFPFAPFMDDVPETNWEKTSDFDFTRLLVSDHNAFQEGYGHLMGLFENPNLKREDIVKVLIESFNKIKDPPGIEGAQKTFYPIVKAAFRMRQMNQWAKWLGSSLLRISRVPRSEIEKGNLQANVADDENAINMAGNALAQNYVIADDPNEVDDRGRTQLQRWKKEMDAEGADILIGHIRMLIQLLGPAFGIELAKALGLKIEG